MKWNIKHQNLMWQMYRSQDVCVLVCLFTWWFQHIIRLRDMASLQRCVILKRGSHHWKPQSLFRFAITTLISCKACNLRCAYHDFRAKVVYSMQTVALELLLSFLLYCFSITIESYIAIPRFIFISKHCMALNIVYLNFTMGICQW